MQKERKIQFNKNGKLKIMQVSDPQDMHIVRSAMVKMLNKVYDKEKPDLIVFTGDNILGNHVDDAIIGPFKNKKKSVTANHIKKALKYILKPVDDRKIPFCMVYGNHDDKNRLSKQEQADFYKEYEYFVGLNSEEKDLDCDTYNLPIYDSKGEKVIYNLWLMDSAGTDDNGENPYEYVKKEAVEWYKRKSDELKAANGGEVVHSLMFQHIPIIETKTLFKECSPDEKGAFEGEGELKGRYFKLDAEKATGFAFEYPCTVEEDFGQLEALKEKGDVCALVFGHDHTNSFTANIEGVNIVQTSGASFRSYGNLISRGVRIFEIDEKDTSTFSTYNVSYFDLFGRNFRSALRYLMGADEMEKWRNLIWGLSALVVVLLLVYIIMITSFNQYLI